MILGGEIYLPSCPVCGSVQPSLYFSDPAGRYERQPRCECGHRRRKMEYLSMPEALERLRVKTIEAVQRGDL